MYDEWAVRGVSGFMGSFLVFFRFSWESVEWHVPSAYLWVLLHLVSPALHRSLRHCPISPVARFIYLLGCFPSNHFSRDVKPPIVITASKLVIPQNHSYFLQILACGSPSVWFSMFSFRGSVTFVVCSWCSHLFFQSFLASKNIFSVIFKDWE